MGRVPKNHEDATQNDVEVYGSTTGFWIEALRIAGGVAAAAIAVLVWRTETGCMAFGITFLAVLFLWALSRKQIIEINFTKCTVTLVAVKGFGLLDSSETQYRFDELRSIELRDFDDSPSLYLRIGWEWHHLESPKQSDAIATGEQLAQRLGIPFLDKFSNEPRRRSLNHP